MGSLKRTPIYDRHVEAGAKMVDYAGFEMPVQYPAGIKKEHMAVRESCGLFDVSHMGEFVVEGPSALATVNHLMTNDFSNMEVGRCRYSPMCNAEGGILDDLLVYKTGDASYMIIVNAANRAKDLAWMEGQLAPETTLTDASDDWGLLAIQGPKAHDILAKVADSDALPAKFYTFQDGVDVAGVTCLVSQTGYTGEMGYEVYCPADKMATVFDALVAAGGDDLTLCGLGARDTLRLEAGMPLYGQEMTEDITPFEAGLGFFVKMDKDDFIGKDALTGKESPDRKRVGLKILGRGIARTDYPVAKDGETVGVVTSGTQLPYLAGAYAMALVDADLAQEGQTLDVIIRDKPVEAEVVALPFYKRA